MYWLVWEQIFIICMISAQSFISYLQSRLNNLIVFMQFVFFKQLWIIYFWHNLDRGNFSLCIILSNEASVLCFLSGNIINNISKQYKFILNLLLSPSFAFLLLPGKKSSICYSFFQWRYENIFIFILIEIQLKLDFFSFNSMTSFCDQLVNRFLITKWYLMDARI